MILYMYSNIQYISIYFGIFMQQFATVHRVMFREVFSCVFHTKLSGIKSGDTLPALIPLNLLNIYYKSFFLNTDTEIQTETTIRTTAITGMIFSIMIICSF